MEKGVYAGVCVFFSGCDRKLLLYTNKKGLRGTLESYKIKCAFWSLLNTSY